MSNELFQQRISCVVCERPLPPKRHENEDDPGYCPVTSTGYRPGWEPERNCEDIDRLLRHLAALNNTFVAEVEYIRETEEADAARPAGEQPTGTDDAFDRTHSLCVLFCDIQEELERRFGQFAKWVYARHDEGERRLHKEMTSHYTQQNPPTAEPETNQH
jgi:hypothetical protein